MSENTKLKDKVIEIFWSIVVAGITSAISVTFIIGQYTQKVDALTEKLQRMEVKVEVDEREMKVHQIEQAQQTGTLNSTLAGMQTTLNEVKAQNIALMRAFAGKR